MTSIRPVCLCFALAALAAAQGLRTVAGLEVKLWASEPQLVNPTNIDIDERGRVWALEGVNYRRQLRNEKDYRAGDRILILEDSDADGRADRVKVFDEGPHLRAPLGIAVLGDRVIVSQSPDIVVYTKDAADRVVKREVLLTGFRGVDHDHGVHAVVFGPDGRYYFDAGDQGFDVTDRSGRRFLSARTGPYYAGCALRMNPDGTGLSVVGHNFRNPYELALDSFGNIWQTDNDDDGNAWVRVNYVMEGGNFGYWGPGGRSWREDKGSHFHSELPGVVPNIARTGAGAPCGLAVYEGLLLPGRYRGHLLHAEAGKRLINTYRLSADGAGFRMETEDTVAADDAWFRPSDVAVAPDGSVYFSDWYDAAVGGHQMVDIRRGRIYRLAPPGAPPRVPALDLETAAGLADALRSPAQSVRYLAWTRLHARGAAALPALEAMWRQDDPVLRARALWLLGSLGAAGRRSIEEALRHADARFRVLAIRVLRINGGDLAARLEGLLADPSPQVRREAALAVRDLPDSAAVEPLVALSRVYDGRDRWYLEALGIAARGRENLLYPRLREAFPGFNPLLAALLWEFRPADAVPFLISHASDGALDALAAMPSAEAARAVARLAAGGDAALADRAFAHLARRLFSEWIDFRGDPAVAAAVRAALADPRRRSAALELAADLGDPAYLPQLERLADTGPAPQRALALRAVSYARPDGLDLKLRRIVAGQEPNEIRAEAVRLLGRSAAGLNFLLDLQEKGELPGEVRNLAAALANSSRDPQVRARARRLLPPLAARGNSPLPPPRVLLAREADTARGRKVFSQATGPRCNSCHTVGQGRKVGPDLATIGGKLGREALLDAILNPSAGIAPEYYQWVLETRSQGQVIGILAEDTPQRVAVRTENDEEIRLRPEDILSRRRSRLSMMPDDLVNQMSEQELVDLVAYLATLRGPLEPSATRP